MKLSVKKLCLPAAIAAAALVLAACGGSGSSSGSGQTTAAATEAAKAETAAQTEAKAEETKAAETEAAAEESKAAVTKQAADEAAGDAGKYVIYEYEANGNKVTHEMLQQAGMGDTYLELNEDGTGKLNLFQSLLDITWEPGEITVYGSSKYTYTIEGDKLNLDMQGVYYTMLKDGSAALASAGGSSSGSGSGSAASGASASGEPYINDGTIEGTYRLWSMMGMSLAEWAEIMGTSMEQAADSMRVEIVDEKTARVSFDTEEDLQEVSLTMDGENVKLAVEDETMEGTLKDGVLTFNIEGEEVVLVRLTDAAFEKAPEPDKGEAAVWTGVYTKYVGDEDPSEDEEPFSLELYGDGTGVSHRDDLDLQCTWELDGEDIKMTETFMGMTLEYTGTMSGSELHLFNGDPEDDFTFEYVYTSDGSMPTAGSQTDETKAAEAGGSEADAAGERPEGVPGGDGIVGSEEELLKDYVWMDKVAKNVFSLTYEDLVKQFGVEGKFDKEEYSDHMKVNKRYYYWISPEDKNHFMYVNFEEDDPEGAPGVYTVSSYNSSGFLGSEAAEKYLDEVQAAANEADKAAAANMPMKDFSVDVAPWGSDDKVKFTMQIPESGWAYDESRDHLVENEDINAWDVGFIQFKVEPEVSKFDFYKDKFENYQDIEDREIGGVTFAGRTYKNIGYNWTEYIAQIDDAHAVSIGIVRLDTSEGSMCDKILGSLSFK